jgi:CBS domain containing-hemolysin-like protein
MLILVGLLLILGLTVATGYFVAQEFAYVAVDRGALRAAADGGDRASARALRVSGRLSFMLSGAQLGITVTALLAGYVAEPYLGQGLADLLDVAGLPTAVSMSVAVAVALLFATVVQMVLGELAPKNLAIARPEALARWLSRSTLLYLAVAGPVIRLFDAASNWLLRRAGIEPVEELPQGATAEDLDRIIESSRDSGRLDPDTARLLDHGLDFRSRTAGEAMVHRVDVVMVRAEDTAERVVDLLDTGHTRFPVIGESVDDLIGIVSIADVVEVEPHLRHTVTAGALAQPPLLVAEAARLPGVLEQLRAEHRQLACVIDEYGGFAGVIGLENIAEELVGDIRDDDDAPEPDAARQPDGSWLLPGQWRLHEIADVTGVQLPDGEAYDTVSGLLMARLGRIPTVGDEVSLDLPRGIDDENDQDGDGNGDGDTGRRVLLRVERVARHVPATVRLTVRPAATGSGPGGSA